jgi:hypothetical protein
MFRRRCRKDTAASEELAEAREYTAASRRRAEEEASEQEEKLRHEQGLVAELRQMRQRNHVGEALRALVEGGDGKDAARGAG